LLSVRDSVSQMLSDTATSIRESLMEPDELYNFRRSRVDELTAQFRTETDPQRLQQIAEQINSIVGQLYQGLDETQRPEMAQGFIDFLGGIDQILQEQVGIGLDALDASATSVNDQITTAMMAGIEQQVGVNAEFATSVGLFGQAVQQLLAGLNNQAANTTTTTSSTGGGFAATSTVVNRVVSGSGFRSGVREVNA